MTSHSKSAGVIDGEILWRLSIILYRQIVSQFEWDLPWWKKLGEYWGHFWPLWKVVQSPDSRFIKTSLTLLIFVWNYYFFTLKIWNSSLKVIIHNSNVFDLCSLSIRCQKIWMNRILQNHEMRIGDKQIYILWGETNFECPLRTSVLTE